MDEEIEQQLRALGKQLRNARKKRNMTQQQLADLAHLDIRNVQRIEYGEINPVYTTLARLRQALDAEWSELMGK